MAYRRRSFRRSNGQRDKYSVEQTGFTGALPAEATNGLRQQAVVVVPAAALQGMRKVKHLTISLTETGAEAWVLYWALVFVPAGYQVNPLFATAGEVSGSLYEPNQFVMNAGIVDPTAGPIRFRSPVSRNLSSGDQIYLVIGSTFAGSASRRIFGVVRYAVTLQ